jgi:DNA-directed RNA polymerase alpha subunit
MNAEQFGNLLMSLADMTPSQKEILVACMKGTAEFEDKPLASMNVDELSVRARKTLRRANITMKSQIMRATLEEQRNCGVTTANEILDWAARQ